MEIRQKDILFVALAVPAALAAAYAWMWRAPLARECDELATRSALLVAADDFPMERRRAQSRLDEANAALAAARAEGEAAPAASGGSGVSAATVSAAERERAALAVLRGAGLDVLRSELLPPNASRRERNAPEDVLRAANDGIEPIRRRWTLSGPYPAIKRALDSFAAAGAAVVPARLAMQKPGLWILEAAL